jgi:hypothetical protein
VQPVLVVLVLKGTREAGLEEEGIHFLEGSKDAGEESLKDEGFQWGFSSSSADRVEGGEEGVEGCRWG